jgi:hypothetical protein
VITYDMRCAFGHLFEVTRPSSVEASNAACPVCGEASTRHWSASFAVGARASAGPSREQMPRSWEAVRSGERATVRGWHELARKREALEQKHPELRGDARPFLAHEGRFAHRPLRAGDPLPGSVVERASRGGQSVNGERSPDAQ